MSISNKRIFGAFLVGFGLVGAAFLISKYMITPVARTNAVEKSALTVGPRDHITITDSDSDGIPDWQSTLVTSNPIVVSSATSTYTPPDTLTGEFGIKFFNEMMMAHEYGLLEDKREELVAEAVKSLEAETRDKLYTKNDISVIESNDEEILKSYGDLIALIVITHPLDVDNEVVILEDLIETKDLERLKDLEPIQEAYASMVEQMLATEPPTRYAQEHLNLLNAYNAVLKDIEAMQKVYEDPLYTLLRYKRYGDDILGMSNALSAIYNRLYLRDNVRWEEGDPTLKLIRFDE